MEQGVYGCNLILEAPSPLPCGVGGIMAPVLQAREVPGHDGADGERRRPQWASLHVSYISFLCNSQ